MFNMLKMAESQTEVTRRSLSTVSNLTGVNTDHTKLLNSENDGKPQAQPINLTDQTIDSKEYIAKYLSFTKSDAI